MTHFVLRTFSGQEIEFDGESIADFRGESSTYGSVFRIQREDTTLYIMSGWVESVSETIIPPPPPPHVEWETVDVNYLYDNGLSVRSYNCLKRAGINNIADLLRYIDEHGDLKRIRNLGAHSQCEIAKMLFDMYALDIFTGEVKTDGTDS